MNVYYNKRSWKLALFLFAVSIGIVSLYYTEQLVNELKHEERKKMEIWAEAMRYISTVDSGAEINFYVNVITNNKTIPVLLTKPVQGYDSIISVVNIPDKKAANNVYITRQLEQMKAKHDPIVIEFSPGEKNIIYYNDSTILRKLAVYPYIQLGVIALFILIAYLAFSSSRKVEQNKVWVGMAKETAHQLGTPISSLNAWTDILAQFPENAAYIGEMEKDVVRLNQIAERFSKVGSIPETPLVNFCETLDAAVAYMQTRSSKHVQFDVSCKEVKDLIIPLNSSLFYWVIENIVKNAIDAMNGKGIIRIQVSEEKKTLLLDISDTGKGLPKSMFKTIFKPGLTTKERGWGLGLSLAKRIIENYHQGKISVLQSEVGKGTTFRIVLPKQESA